LRTCAGLLPEKQRGNDRRVVGRDAVEAAILKRRVPTSTTLAAEPGTSGLSPTFFYKDVA